MMSSSQFYGAGEFLGKRRGLLPNASWTHGVIFCPVSPYQIISREDSIFDYHLVTDEIQADIARQVFDNVMPVGLPFAHAFDRSYCPLAVRDIDRLFLSSHSIRGEKETSVQSIIKIAREFDCSSIILPGRQFESVFGCPLSEVTYADMQIFKGASPKDYESYKRIISIFSRTKMLVTNCAGSHIYYAAACDCEIECELTEVAESTIYEKKKAGLIGLKEPWRSAIEAHFNDYRKTETMAWEFSNFSRCAQKEMALKKIGYEFIGNLDGIKKNIQNSSLPTLLAKNVNLFLVKLMRR